MKILLATLSLMLLIFGLQAQDLTGNWYGVLHVQNTNLHLVFHINKSGDAYSSTMDSPDQGAHGLSIDKTIINGNTLSIELAQLNLKYSGTYLPDSNKITGIFTQGTVSLPLALTRDDKSTVVTAAKRPQDPATFPYTQEEIVFNNVKAEIQLAGTLTLPSSGKFSKIVILISGSGPQNRDEEIPQFNHRPFLVWSDWLCRNGIAVLRYDDRGIGKSTGSFGTATTADFADDTEAAINFIQSRSDLKRLDIGLMGHSEGGMIAPMVAGRNKAVRFMVLLAAPGVEIQQLMVQQLNDQMHLANTPANIAELAASTNTKLFAAMNQYKALPDQEFKAAIDTVLRTQLLKYPKDILGTESIDAILNKSSAQYNSPWFKYFITFNPAEYLTKVKCPVLALNGTLDMQVQSSSNLPAIGAGLQKGGNTKFEIVPLTGLNHLFQQAKTGSTKEYREIEETVNPAALSKVSDWINQL